MDATGPKNVTYGSDVSILCVPIGGIPVPELDFQGSENSALPPRSEIRDGLDSSVLQVTNAQKSFCVDCTGTNLEGEHTDTHCVDVLGKSDMIQCMKPLITVACESCNSLGHGDISNTIGYECTFLETETVWMLHQMFFKDSLHRPRPYR